MVNKPLVIMIFENYFKLHSPKGKYNYDTIFSVSLIACTCYLAAVFIRSFARTKRPIDELLHERTNEGPNKQTNKQNSELRKQEEVIAQIYISIYE